MADMADVVEVNELPLFNTGRGLDHWLGWRQLQPAQRLDIRGAYPAGQLVWVACDSREDAQWLRGWLIDGGVPHTALRVRHVPDDPPGADCPRCGAMAGHWCREAWSLAGLSGRLVPETHPEREVAPGG